MNPISRRFRHIILLSVAALPSMALAQPTDAQPAPPNTTVEIPGRAANTDLATVTWDELQQQIGGPTLVSLHAEKMPPLKIIEELNRQTSVPIEAYSPESESWDNTKLFSANYDRQPLWSVARDLTRQMKIGLSTSSNGVRFAPYRSEIASLATTAGPGIFTLSEASNRRFLVETADKEAPNPILQLNGRLYLDPKVPWQNNELSLHIAEAIDANDQSLVLESNGGNSEVSSYSQPAELQIILRPGASRLKLLRGSLHGIVAFNGQPWEIGDAMNAKNVEKIVGEGEESTRIELQEVKQDGDDYRVTWVISPGKTASRSFYRMLNLSTGKRILFKSVDENVQLLDEKGRALKKIKVDSKWDGDAQTRIYTYTARFRPVPGDQNQRTGPPATVVLYTNTEYRELVVPFEFKDIPLP